MKRTIASQLRDLGIYVAVGIAMLVGVWALVAYDARGGVPRNPARVNWLSLGLLTCVVYINAIHEGLRFRRQLRFWAGLGLALLVQVVGSVVAIWNAPHVHVFTWMMAFLLNIAALDQFMRWWLRSAGSDGAHLAGRLTRG